MYLVIVLLHYIIFFLFSILSCFPEFQTTERNELYRMVLQQRNRNSDLARRKLSLSFFLYKSWMQCHLTIAPRNFISFFLRPGKRRSNKWRQKPVLKHNSIKQSLNRMEMDNLLDCREYMGNRSLVDWIYIPVCYIKIVTRK